MITNRRVKHYIYRSHRNAKEIEMELFKAVLIAMDRNEYDEFGGYPADLLRDAAVIWNKRFKGPANSIMYRVEGYTFEECVE